MEECGRQGEEETKEKMGIKSRKMGIPENKETVK
jgi:hypothetical protein